MNTICKTPSRDRLGFEIATNGIPEITNAPRSVFETSGISWLEPVQIAATTIAGAATKPATITKVLEILDCLTEDDYLGYLRRYYREGLRKFECDWNYADLMTFLYASAKLIAPRNYLEIGVRRGRSLAVIAATCPSCEIYGFDMWMADYAGMPNPGPDFVAEELREIGFGGSLNLVSGDSHETVPSFFADRPELTFDLINVDGDHSELGARADLEVVLPRLRVGGAIILDDIVHPQHLYLEDVWDEMIGRDPNFSSTKYRELGYGVALAIRKR